MQQPRASTRTYVRTCIAEDSRRIIARARERACGCMRGSVCQVGKPILKRHRIFISRCTVATDKSTVHRALRTYGTPVIAPSGIRTTSLCIWVARSETTWTVRSRGREGEERVARGRRAARCVPSIPQSPFGENGRKGSGQKDRVGAAMISISSRITAIEEIRDRCRALPLPTRENSNLGRRCASICVTY